MGSHAFWTVLFATIVSMATVNAEETTIKERQALEQINRALAMIRHDRFQLWNECKPLHIVVLIDALKDELPLPDLTENRIEIAVRSRLRAAQIYNQNSDDKSGGILFARLFLIGNNAFFIAMEYTKMVFDYDSKESGRTPVWMHERFGTHSEDSTFVINSIAEITDKFIDEYLRVNADAC